MSTIYIKSDDTILSITVSSHRIETEQESTVRATEEEIEEEWPEDISSFYSELGDIETSDPISVEEMRKRIGRTAIYWLSVTLLSVVCGLDFHLYYGLLGHIDLDQYYHDPMAIQTTWLVLRAVSISLALVAMLFHNELLLLPYLGLQYLLTVFCCSMVALWFYFILVLLSNNSVSIYDDSVDVVEELLNGTRSTPLSGVDSKYFSDYGVTMFAIGSLMLSSHLAFYNALFFSCVLRCYRVIRRC